VVNAKVAGFPKGLITQRLGSPGGRCSTHATQLYDRREDRVTLNEVVKINIRG